MALIPGFLTTLIVATAKQVVRFETAVANRRAAKALLEWDARALKDIGLTRGDVRGALSQSVLEDPTLTLSLIAAGREFHGRRDSASRPQSDDRAPASKVRLGKLPSAEPVPCT